MFGNAAATIYLYLFKRDFTTLRHRACIVTLEFSQETRSSTLDLPEVISNCPDGSRNATVEAFSAQTYKEIKKGDSWFKNLHSGLTYRCERL